MIGLFDSGSGGLTILNALSKSLPEQDFLYFGDHANAPYGHRSNDQILELTQKGVDILMQAGCSLVILACNTAAAIALRSLQQNWLPHHYPNNRILGVLVPMVEAVTGQSWNDDKNSYTGKQTNPYLDQQNSREILLFATRKTIESGAYREEVMKRAPDVRLIEKPCPGLVDAIEGGAGHAPLLGLVNGYVQEIFEKNHNPEAAILGCTHFPLVDFAFQAALNKGRTVALFSQPEIVSMSTQEYLNRHPEFQQPASGKKRTITCWTSGENYGAPPMLNNPDIQLEALPDYLKRSIQQA